MPKNNFDCIRLFAAIAIFFYHCIAYYSNAFVDVRFGLFNLFFIWTGKIAMFTFFFISGYLVTASYTKSKNIFIFLKKRWLRIYPAQLFATVLMVFIIGPMLSTVNLAAYSSSWVTYKYLLYESLLITNTKQLPGVYSNKCINPSTWSLYLEVKLYIILGILGSLGIFKYKKIVLLLFIVFTLVANLVSRAYLQSFTTINISVWLDYGSYFILGSICYLFKDYVKFKPYNLLLLLILYYSSYALHIATDLFETYFYAYLILYLAIGIKQTVQLNNDFSYGIFLWHAPVLIFMVNYLTFVNNLLLFILVAACITFAFAALSWYVVERRYKYKPQKLIT